MSQRYPKVVLYESSLALLDELFDGVYIVDRKHTVLFWNTGAEQLTGYKRETIVGLQCPDTPLRHEDESGCPLCQELCPARKAMASGEPVTAVVYAYCADGRKVPMETHIRPLTDPDGGVVGAIEVFRDVSQWKKVEQLSREKDQLLGTLTHDIRNPLTVIQTYALLLHRVTPKQMPGVAQAMVRKTKYALALVNNLLDAKNIENGTVTLNIQDLDLEAALRDCLANFNATAADRDLTLALTVETPGLRLPMDPVRFEEIFNNLISNALKYSPRGTRVEVTLAADDAEVRIAVRDQGVGIKPEEQAALFRPFGLTTNAPLDGSRPHGLGLYIVKKIVDLFHGGVSLQSIPQQGTTFTVTFPRNRPPSAPSA